MFEPMLRHCMDEAPCGEEGFAVDASRQKDIKMSAYLYPSTLCAWLALGTISVLTSCNLCRL